jgi:DNA polymerase III subunit epsilon
MQRAGDAIKSQDLAGLAKGDERHYSSRSTLESSDNLVDPLFPDSLVPSGKGNYDEAMLKGIHEAKRFVVMEGYELDRQDLVDLLLTKAKAGVDVIVLFDPAEGPEEQVKAQMLQQLRDAHLDHMHVAEYAPIKPGKDEYDQILHVKKVIVDRPGGSIAEFSGGINFRTHSLHNFDTGWRLEGVSALDSLRFILEQYQRSTGEMPMDLSRVPSVKQVTARVQKLALELNRELVRVELGAAGKFTVPVATALDMTDLKLRSAEGLNITILVRDAARNGVEEILNRAMDNGSHVTLVPGYQTVRQAQRSIPEEIRLRTHGATILSSSVVVDHSYARIINLELDKAIENKESIDIAAYALSSKDVLDRVLAAKKAGCEIRVLVDDETIGGSVINQKAMTVTAAAGIPTKVLDRAAKEKLAKMAGSSPDTLKLHTKVIILGGNRVLAGSANFSANGLNNNIEDGRLIESKEVAQAYRKTMFEPLWEAATDVHGTERVPAAKRVPIIPTPKMSTRIEDAIFLVFDTETTGFVPSHDDRILSVGAQAVKLQPDGSLKVVDEFSSLVTPGTNLLGKPFGIPTITTNITGLSADSLKKGGARNVKDVMGELVAFIQKQSKNGPVVLAGQNVSFDIRFLDDALSKRGVTAPSPDGKSEVNYRMDSVYVDTVDIARMLFTGQHRFGLDDLMAMLNIKPEDNLHRHDAFGDVVYTGLALGKLVKKGGYKTLGDLLGKDQLDLTKPTAILDAPSAKAGVHFQVQQPAGRTGVVSTRDHLNGAFSLPRHISTFDVVGIENGFLHVKFEAGRINDRITVDGYIDPAKVPFRKPGIHYYELQEGGANLPTPKITRAA